MFWCKERDEIKGLMGGRKCIRTIRSERVPSKVRRATHIKVEVWILCIHRAVVSRI
jgi:hypothetical protein